MMPRRVEKGSFGGPLDDLIKVFRDPPAKDGKDGKAGDRSGENRHIDDRLFESAWRKAQDEGPTA